jgi:hypothetical protein
MIEKITSLQYSPTNTLSFCDLHFKDDREEIRFTFRPYQPEPEAFLLPKNCGQTGYWNNRMSRQEYRGKAR